MAFNVNTIVGIRNGGSDSLNSGFFDPTSAASGGFTDGAATVANTSAPVFTSASYTFVAGDVGAWVFIASGSNWTPGFYQIASVNAGAATLTGTIGSAVAWGNPGLAPTTVVGCATVASPTGATWAIDYSQQDAVEVSYTDLACAGAGLTVSSAANPFGKQQVGNGIRVTGGDANITAGVYVIASVAAGVATVIGAANISTGAVTTGTGGLGGAFATHGGAGAYAANVTSATVVVKYHATPYTSTSTTNNAANGRMTMPAGSAGNQSIIMGYDVVYGDNTGNRPTIKWDTNGGSNAPVTTGGYLTTKNIIYDGNVGTRTGCKTVSSSTGSIFRGCKFANADQSAYLGTSGHFEECEFSVLGAVMAGGVFTNLVFKDCYFHDWTSGVATLSSGQLEFDNCIFDTCAGDIINTTGACFLRIKNCVFYNTTGAGLNIDAAPTLCEIVNTVFESNSTYGIDCAAKYANVHTRNCAFYGNTTAKYVNVGAGQIRGEIIPTGTVFTNAATGDFSLNSTANQGALLQGGGIPATFPGLSFDNNADVGAASSTGSTASTTAYGSAF